MTDELVAFLKARLREEEVAAHTAPAGPWHADGDTVYADHPTDLIVEYAYHDGAEHIARHHPARVLADIQAKWLLLTRWTELQARIDAEEDLDKRGCLALTRHGLDMFVYQLGTVYADHPDYRADWRP